MKKITYLLLLAITISFSSCSIYEEISFKDNGQVSYNMTFDLSEMLKMIPAEQTNSFPNDSIISIAELVGKEMNMDSLSESDEKDLESIAPLYLKITNNEETKNLLVSLYGDFDNTDDLNNAFLSMTRIKDKNKEKASDIKGADAFMQMNNIYSYSWDGKTMSRTFIQTDEDSSEDNSNQNALLGLFSGGKMKIKYHFQQKVKDVSDPDATFSKDGKSVIIDYPASIFIQSPEQTDIKITIE